MQEFKWNEGLPTDSDMVLMLVKEREGFALVSLGLYDIEKDKWIDFLCPNEADKCDLVKRDIIGWISIPDLPMGQKWYTGKGMYRYVEIYKRRMGG